MSPSTREPRTQPSPDRFPIGCRTMRDGVIVAGVFLGAAVVMLIIAATLIPAVLWMQWLVQGLGVLLLLFVPFILITTYLRSGRRPDAP